jgi:predicted kinase
MTMRQSRLIVTSGLPGSGKSSVAEGLARALSVPILAVDPIEAAMWRAHIPKLMTGIAAYEIAAAAAEENLKLGLSVIVDAVNPIEAAREMWRRLAERQQVCHCSDPTIHRNRIEARVRGIAGMPEVTWDLVEERRAEYEPWTVDRVTLDTANQSPERLVECVLLRLGEC